MKKILLLTLCALLLIVAAFGLSIPVRILLGANAILLLIDVAKSIWGWSHGREEA